MHSSFVHKPAERNAYKESANDNLLGEIETVNQETKERQIHQGRQLMH
jgi:hypothetical protein